DHDDVSREAGTAGRLPLNARRIGVDTELHAAGRSRAVLSPAEDAVARTGLVGALPHDDEAARSRGDARRALNVCRVGIDAELRAERAALRPGRLGTEQKQRKDNEARSGHRLTLLDPEAH